MLKALRSRFVNWLYFSVCRATKLRTLSIDTHGVRRQLFCVGTNAVSTPSQRRWALAFTRQSSGFHMGTVEIHYPKFSLLTCKTQTTEKNDVWTWSKSNNSGENQQVGLTYSGSRWVWVNLLHEWRWSKEAGNSLSMWLISNSEHYLLVRAADLFKQAEINLRENSPKFISEPFLCRHLTMKVKTYGASYKLTQRNTLKCETKVATYNEC